jgi:hypothetical protein
MRSHEKNKNSCGFSIGLMDHPQHQMSTQEPTASANLDCEELKNGFVGVVAKGLGVHYVVSVKSVESLPTT